jgi:hypothetical protein
VTNHVQTQFNDVNETFPRVGPNLKLEPPTQILSENSNLGRRDPLDQEMIGWEEFIRVLQQISAPENQRPTVTRNGVVGYEGPMIQTEPHADPFNYDWARSAQLRKMPRPEFDELRRRWDPVRGLLRGVEIRPTQHGYRASTVGRTVRWVTWEDLHPPFVCSEENPCRGAACLRCLGRGDYPE